MAVHHSLGIAGRATGITHGRRLIFVDFRPRIVPGLGSKQILVGQRFPQRRAIPLTHQDEPGAFFQVAGDLRQKRNQRIIHNDHIILGMIDHIEKLLGE